MTAQVLYQYIIDAERAIEIQDWLEAQHILEQALVDEPTYGKAHNHLGWLFLYHLSDYKRAETHLRLAFKYAPGYHAPYMHMAQLLFEAKRFEELEALLNEAMGIAGITRSFIYNDFGRLYEACGKLTKAVRYYKMAAKRSIDSHELDTIKKNVKRCRQKRWIAFW